MLPPKSLIKISNKFKNYDADIRINKTEITVNIDLTKVDFTKILPLLYLLLNKYGTSYYILIKGVPNCLMKDAPEYLLYRNKKNINYQKDKICQNCHYSDTCPGWMIDSKINKRPSEVISMPTEIVFEVTNRCHLSCPICFRPNKHIDMPLEQVKGFIDDCVRLNIKDVRFTGGEPLLYKHIKEALTYAKSKDRYVIVNTTATIMNSELKSVLTNCVDNLLISLQGFNPATNNRLTRAEGGCGADFNAKLRNIVELNGLVPEVRLGTIISRTLLNNLPKYHYLVKSLGVKYWEMYRPMSPDQTGDFNISPEDLITIMKFMRRNKQKRKEILIANPVPYCISKDMSLGKNVSYGARSDDGNTRLIIDAEGFLKPSYLISKNLGYTIEEAWNNPFLTKMKKVDFLPKECQECNALNWCKGGSRYWSKLVNETYYDRDPLMMYESKQEKNYLITH